MVTLVSLQIFYLVILSDSKSLPLYVSMVSIRSNSGNYSNCGVECWISCLPNSKNICVLCFGLSFLITCGEGLELRGLCREGTIWSRVKAREGYGFSCDSIEYLLVDALVMHNARTQQQMSLKGGPWTSGIDLLLWSRGQLRCICYTPRQLFCFSNAVKVTDPEHALCYYVAACSRWLQLIVPS